MRFQIRPALGVERLFRRCEIPVSLGRTFKAELGGELAKIGREVVAVVKPLGQQANARGKPIAIVAVRPVVVSPDGCLVHPRHERRSAGRADRSRGVEPRVTDPLGRQLVEIGRRNFRSATARKLVAEVFGDEPENVGAIGRLHPTSLRHSQAKGHGRDKNQRLVDLHCSRPPQIYALGLNEP